MATFNYRKFLKENKSTFHASLTEGQFSWMTQDTEQQIGSEKENTIDVYMFDNTGKYWFEKAYDGYGEFGGKDYYELVAEMNGYTADDAEEFGGTFKDFRGIGIKLAFGELEPKNGGPVLFPALVADPKSFNYKTYDFTQEAETDPNQSWYTSEYEDEDDYEEEEYGYDEDENELDENKKAYYKDAEADDAEHIEALEKDMEDDKKSSKMTKEELKAKIKEMILSEYEKDVNYTNEDPESEVDFLAELEAMLHEADEETETETEEEVDVDVEDPEPTEEPVGDGGLKVTQNADADLTGTQKELQDNLEAALEAAKKLEDDKLAKQIGNSLTFFTRQHVVKEELSEKLLLKKRAGIITETQYKEYLLILEDENIDESLKSSILAGLIALTSIAGVGRVYKMDAEFEQNKQAQTEYYQNVLTPAAEKLSKAELTDLGLSINEKTKKLALYNQTDPQQIETIFSTYAQNYMRSNPDQFAIGVDGGVVWTLNPTAN